VSPLVNSEILKGKGKKVRPFTEEEFLTAMGLLIAAAEYGQRGASLWKEGDQKTAMRRKSGNLWSHILHLKDS
jgi:hypothetical protein